MTVRYEAIYLGDHSPPSTRGFEGAASAVPTFRIEATDAFGTRPVGKIHGRELAHKIVAFLNGVPKAETVD